MATSAGGLQYVGLDWYGMIQSVPSPRLQHGAAQTHSKQSEAKLADAVDCCSGAEKQRSADTSRYGTTLNARIASIGQAHDIPATYLDYDQVYTVRIVDTNHQAGDQVRYRTFVQLLFHAKRQHEDAVACWSLWEGAQRAREVQLRKPALPAVECVGIKPLALDTES